MEFLSRHLNSWTAALCYLFHLGIVISTAPSPEDFTPSQLRLTFGDTPRDIVVMAATKANCTASVQYGKGYFTLDTTVSARTVKFGADQRNPEGLQFLHRAKLQNLDPGADYFYLMTCDSKQSKKMPFKVPPSMTDWSPKFLVYGDLGLETESMPALQKEAQSGEYTAVLHLGDMAYQLESDGGKHGDQFMDMIEPVAGQLPYLTTPGNHEDGDDTFYHYRYRFSTPQTQWPIPLQKMWYSVDIGPVHLISYSTEVFNMTDKQYISLQRDWLVSDLKRANANRQFRPWIIVFADQPMYCSSLGGDDCSRDKSVIRQNFEDIFFEQSVDLILNGHKHAYERLWPTYKGTVHATNYTNPTAPVSVISGTAGNRLGLDPLAPEEGPWTAFRMSNGSLNSFGTLSIVNSTHLYWEQVSAVGDNQVIDSFWIEEATHQFATVFPDEIPPSPIDEINEVTTSSESSKNKTDVKSGVEEVFQKVKDVIKSNKGLAIGVTSAISVLVFACCVCVIVKCRKRRASPARRWEKLDYDKSFYTDVKTAEDDFSYDEAELQSDGNGTMPTSKLLGKSTV